MIMASSLEVDNKFDLQSHGTIQDNTNNTFNNE